MHRAARSMEPAGGRDAAPGRNEVEGGIGAARVPRAAQLARDSLDGEEIDDGLQASRKERDVWREDKKGKLPPLFRLNSTTRASCTLTLVAFAFIPASASYRAMSRRGARAD